MNQQDPGRGHVYRDHCGRSAQGILDPVAPGYTLENYQGEVVRVYTRRRRAQQGRAYEVSLFPAGGGPVLSVGTGRYESEARKAAGI